MSIACAILNFHDLTVAALAPPITECVRYECTLKSLVSTGEELRAAESKNMYMQAMKSCKCCPVDIGLLLLWQI